MTGSGRRAIPAAGAGPVDRPDGRTPDRQHQARSGPQRMPLSPRRANRRAAGRSRHGACQPHTPVSLRFSPSPAPVPFPAGLDRGGRGHQDHEPFPQLRRSGRRPAFRGVQPRGSAGQRHEAAGCIPHRSRLMHLFCRIPEPAAAEWKVKILRSGCPGFRTPGTAAACHAADIAIRDRKRPEPPATERPLPWRTCACRAHVPPDGQAPDVRTAAIGPGRLIGAHPGAAARTAWTGKAAGFPERPVRNLTRSVRARADHPLSRRTCFKGPAPVSAAVNGRQGSGAVREILPAPVRTDGKNSTGPRQRLPDARKAFWQGPGRLDWAVPGRGANEKDTGAGSRAARLARRKGDVQEIHESAIFLIFKDFPQKPPFGNME